MVGVVYRQSELLLSGASVSSAVNAVLLSGGEASVGIAALKCEGSRSATAPGSVLPQLEKRK